MLATLAALAVASTADWAAEPAGGAIGMSAIDHVGINVPDIDAATRFFAELLGTRVVHDVRPKPVSAEWKRRFAWHPASQVDRIVVIETVAGERIELFQYHGPDVSRRQPHEDDAGATHIALRVRDIDAGLAVVRRHGLRVLCEPVTNADGTRWFYFLTPWNSQLELVVPPSSH